MREKRLLPRLAALVLGLGLALGLAACGGSDSGSGAGSTAETSSVGDAAIALKLGYVTTPQHPYGIAIDAFAKGVSTASAGRITVQTIPTYQGGDVPLLNDVQTGAVQMASVSSAIWDTKGVKSFQALQAPFLVNRLDLEDQVISGDIGKQMLKGVDKLGLVGLAIHEGGLRKPLGHTKPLKSPADFAGQKIRAPESGVLSEGLKALGAEPTPLPLPEVYLALKNGTADGMEANLGLIDTNKYYEVAKYVTQNVNLWPFPTVLVMNKAAWDALSGDDQALIQAEAAKIPSLSIKIFTNPAPTAPNFVKSLCDKGLTFAFASDADQAALKKAAQTAVDNLSSDPEVKGFVDQIQTLKDSLPAPAEPPPLPDGCKKA